MDWDYEPVMTNSKSRLNFACLDGQSQDYSFDLLDFNVLHLALSLGQKEAWPCS